MAITRRWQTGFEFGTLAEFSGTFGAVAISTVAPYTGTYSLVFPASSTVLYGETTLPATYQARTGFFIRPRAHLLTTFDAEIFTVYDASSNALVKILVDGATDNIEVYVGGTLRDTMNDPNFGVWQHWGVDFKIDATAGWVTIYRNGVEWASYEGNTGAAQATKMRWGPYGTNAGFGTAVYIDDIYIDDTTGELAAAPVPNYRYLLQPVIGNGAYNGNWAGSDGDSVNNYAMVDDVPPDDDTTYLSAGSALLESFTGGTITLPDDTTINANIPTVMARKTEAGGTNQLIVFSRTGAVDDAGPAQDLSTAYAFYFDYQPGTVLADEIGIEHV